MSKNLKRIVLILAAVSMLALAGCGGEVREEGEPPVQNDTVIESVEVVEVDGEKYVCFSQTGATNGGGGKQMECLPHNGSSEPSDDGL